MTAAYDEDLAYIHHVGFGSFARDATPGLLESLRAANIHTGLVVDLGCGSGLWIRELVTRGYAALGIDSSRAMIEIARSVAPTARFAVADIHACEIPPCSAVTALGEVLNYCRDGRPENHTVEPLIARVAEALSPGGLFIFDVLLACQGEPMRYRTWRTGPDWTVLVAVDEDPHRRLLMREIVTFRKDGAGYRKSSETHLQRTFEREELEKTLRRFGFTVRFARKYGRRPLAPRRLAFYAQKTTRAAAGGKTGL